MESLCSANIKRPNIESSYVDFSEDEAESPCLLSLAPFSLLSKYTRASIRKLEQEGFGAASKRSEGCDDHELSIVEILKLAKGRHTCPSSSRDSNDHPVFSNSSWAESPGLSQKDTEKVELVELLLTCADKFSDREFDQVIELLRIFRNFSPINGNPLERIVYHFANAIRDRINQEIGQTSTDQQRNIKTKARYVEEAVKKLEPALFAWHQEIPFVQIAMFTGIQAILDSVSNAKRIHYIVFGIRAGICITALMQALAARCESPTELLKVTAVESGVNSAEETGKRLVAFADSLGLSFIFEAVAISDLKDLKDEVFEVENYQATAVNFSWFLSNATPCPGGLEALMRVIRKLSPSIVVVSEMEANTGLPNLMDRFVEAFTLYGSLFDCFEDCMDRDNENRITFEAVYLGYGMRDLLKSEGEVRSSFHRKVEEWRDYFAGFDMFETGLSSSCLFQAKLVADRFRCGGSCTLEANGKSLLIGWKGTPVASLSAWKFKQDQGGKRKSPM